MGVVEDKGGGVDRPEIEEALLEAIKTPLS
jgi:hypothetical protein